MSTTTSNQTEAQTVARKPETLAQACVFKGERIETLAKMTSEEAIRLSSFLIDSGDTTKARGVYVFATVAKSITDEKEAKEFMMGLKAEFIATAKAKLPANASKGAQLLAEEEGKKRFDNLGQAIRAARFVLDNPGKVADSVSVFTVTQANAFLALPALKDDADAAAKTAHAERAKVQAAVLPLLKKGASQAAVKKAIADTKEAIAKDKEAANKAAEPVLTAEELKEKGQKDQLVIVRAKLRQACDEWDKAVQLGISPAAIRAEAFERDGNGHTKETFAQKVRELAKLAGLEVK